MPDGISHGQEPFGLPVRHTYHDNRMLARAQALKDDAAEIAWQMGMVPVHQQSRIAAMIREHTGLMLRAMAAEQIAQGNMVLARAYVSSALRMEREG